MRDSKAKSTNRLLIVSLGLIALAAVWWSWPPSTGSVGNRVTSAPTRAQAAPVQVSATDPGYARVRAAARASALASEPAADPAFLACGRDTNDAFEATGRRLIASRDGRDRAVGALLLQVQGDVPPGQKLRLLAAAQHAAPTDPWIAFLASQSCDAPGCDTRLAANRLLAVDSDNVFAWLTASTEALIRKDTDAAEDLLRRAAQADRVDAYWGTAGQQMFERTADIAQPASCTRRALASWGEVGGRPLATMDDMRAIHVMAVAAAMLPAMRPMSELCPTQRSIPSHRLETCRRLYARLAASNDLIYQSMGVRGMQAYATSAAERARWRERQRRLAWLSQEAAQRMTAAHLPLVWEYGEVPTMMGLVEESGRWPPPPGWRPPVHQR